MELLRGVCSSGALLSLRRHGCCWDSQQRPHCPDSLRPPDWAGSPPSAGSTRQAFYVTSASTKKRFCFCWCSVLHQFFPFSGGAVFPQCFLAPSLVCFMNKLDGKGQRKKEVDRSTRISVSSLFSFSLFLDLKKQNPCKDTSVNLCLSSRYLTSTAFFFAKEETFELSSCAKNISKITISCQMINSRSL